MRSIWILLLLPRECPKAIARRIIFPPFVIFILEAIPEAAKYMKAFDIFTLSSVKEGLPYTLLEAMAASRPVVVTNSGGMPEIVNGSEKSGIVVPARNPEELGKAIATLIKDVDIREKYGTHGRKKIENSLNLETMIRKTIDVYEEMRSR